MTNRELRKRWIVGVALVAFGASLVVAEERRAMPRDPAAIESEILAIKASGPEDALSASDLAYMKSLMKQYVYLTTGRHSASPATPAGLQGGETCATAVGFTSSFFTQGTTAGTADDIDLSSCASGTVFALSGVGGDVFYSFSNASGGVLDIAMSDTAGDDLGIYVLDDALGGCGAGNAACIAVDDSNFGGSTENVTVAYPGGNDTYFIFVDGYGGETGPFDLTVDFIPPAANDACATPLPLSCGVTSGYNLGSGPDGQPSCGAADDQSSVWYTFVAVGNGTVSLDTCGAGTDYDTELAMYSGSCGSLGCLQGNDDFCGLQSGISNIPVVQGQTYYVMVDGFAGSQGNYELFVDCSNLVYEPPLIQEIPTLGTFGLAALVLLLGAGAFLVLRRRQRA